MLGNDFLIIAGLIVITMVVLGFIFTAHEFTQLEEKDDKHFNKKNVTKVTFDD